MSGAGRLSSFFTFLRARRLVFHTFSRARGIRFRTIVWRATTGARLETVQIFFSIVDSKVVTILKANKILGQTVALSLKLTR